MSDPVETLLHRLPLDRAMEQLVVTQPRPDGAGLIDLSVPPLLLAGLWQYVDDLGASHALCQSGEGDATFDLWHAILHRREGDFSNSRYWLREVGEHPVFALMPAAYDPVRLTHDVEHAHRDGLDAGPLVALQRAEWLTLIRWCQRQGTR